MYIFEIVDLRKDDYSDRWDEIKARGKPATVHARNKYVGYIVGKGFYYKLKDGGVKAVPVASIKSKITH